MAEILSNLHVVGRTAEGRVWHTIRSPGAWTPFGDVLAAANRLDLTGNVVDVAAARLLGTNLVEGLYVLLALNNGRPVLLFRSSDTGLWSEEASALFGEVRRVAAAVSTALTLQGSFIFELHMAGVTDDGVLKTAVHQPRSNSPDVPANVELTAGERGEFRAVALGGESALDVSGTSATLVASTADGRVYTTRGSSSTSWEQFKDLETAGAGERGDIVDVATMVGADRRSFFLAVSGEGRAWMATQFIGGTWQQWQDLETITIVVTGPGVSWTTTGIADVGTFERIAGATTTEGQHILGVTSNGRLWHQLRPSASAQFRDVELVGVGQNVGAFTAVGCA